MSLYSEEAASSTYSYASPSRKLAKAKSQQSPGAATVAASVASFEVDDSSNASFWADLRQREVDRARLSTSYQPAYSANHEQIRKGVRDFVDRMNQGGRYDEFPAVLVATHAKQIPPHTTMSRIDLENGLHIGQVKFFLDNHGSLFIVSLSAKEIHGTGVEFIQRGMMRFTFAFDQSLSSRRCH